MSYVTDQMTRDQFWDNLKYATPYEVFEVSRDRIVIDIISVQENLQNTRMNPTLLRMSLIFFRHLMCDPMAQQYHEYQVGPTFGDTDNQNIMNGMRLEVAPILKELTARLYSDDLRECVEIIVNE